MEFFLNEFQYFTLQQHGRGLKTGVKIRALFLNQPSSKAFHKLVKKWTSEAQLATGTKQPILGFVWIASLNGQTEVLFWKTNTNRCHKLFSGMQTTNSYFLAEAGNKKIPKTGKHFKYTQYVRIYFILFVLGKIRAYFLNFPARHFTIKRFKKLT